MKTRKRRNGEPTATFEELTFAEQAKSISAATNVLGLMIDSNLRRAEKEGRDVDEIKKKRLDQVRRMINKRK